MNIQSSVQPTPAIQCYGCHMNIYQGPVDHSEPKKRVKQSSRLAVTFIIHLYYSLIHHFICD